MAGEDGSVSDIFDEHRFAEAIGAAEEEVACLRNEVEGESAVDDGAVNLGRPGPIKVGDGFEATETGQAKAALKAAARLVGQFVSRDLFEEGVRRPTLGSGAGNEVGKVGGGNAQADLGKQRSHLRG